MTNNSISKDADSTESVFTTLRDIIRQPPSGSTDSQRLSLVVIRTTCRKDYEVQRLYHLKLTIAHSTLHRYSRGRHRCMCERLERPSSEGRCRACVHGNV